MVSEDDGPKGRPSRTTGNTPAGMALWYVYISRLRDGRFYVGISHQGVRMLLAEHQSERHSQFTSAEGLKRVEWTEAHQSRVAARKREQQLKGWSHAKKEALIEGDLDRLKSLARSRRAR